MSLQVAVSSIVITSHHPIASTISTNETISICQERISTTSISMILFSYEHYEVITITLPSISPNVNIFIVVHSQFHHLIFTTRFTLNDVAIASDVLVSKTSNSASTINNTPKKNDMKKYIRYLRIWNKADYYDSFFLLPCVPIISMIPLLIRSMIVSPRRKSLQHDIYGETNQSK